MARSHHQEGSPAGQSLVRREDLVVSATESLNRLGPPTQGNGERISRRLWAAVLLAMAGVAAVAWWFGANTQTTDEAASRADAPSPSWITVPVEFRILSSTLITRGEAVAATITTISAPTSLDGTAVVTNAPVGIGDVVNEGDRVLEVSGRPVFALQGQTPVYRSLKPGTSGQDVAALQASLSRLGYSIEPSELGVFGPATSAAVGDFYASAGYEPLLTSESLPEEVAAAERALADSEAALAASRASLDAMAAGPAPSQVAQADEAVAAAQRQLEGAQADVVTDVALAQAALDSAVARRLEIEGAAESSDAAIDAANAAVALAEVELDDVVRVTNDAVEAAQAALNIASLARQELASETASLEAHLAVEAAERARDDAAFALAELNRLNGATVPQGEVVFVDSMPARALDGASSPTTSEDGFADSAGGADGSLLSLASGDILVTAELPLEDARLVSEGLPAELLDEASGSRFAASVQGVGEEPSSAGDGVPVRAITVAPDSSLPDSLVGRNLRVTLTAASTETKQLVVPLAAVTSGTDGSARVSVLHVDADGPVRVPVVAGISADGFVAVRPAAVGDLAEGDQVIVGR